MGTTKTALQSDAVLAQPVFVMAVEGYNTLLHTGSSNAAVTTAWAGTDWSTAVRGMEVPKEYVQTMVPFRPRIEASPFTVVVKPDESETFAKVVFASNKSTGNVTKLNESDNVVDNDDTGNITVLSSTPFAASGEIHIGCECIGYTSKPSATAFGGTITRGKYSPFAIDGGTRFGRYHKASVTKGAVVSAPWVTDYPRVWTGRWVGIWLHRNTNGTLDTKAQAECVFAGRINEVEVGQDGAVAVRLLDVRDLLTSRTLLQDQYEATLGAGIYIPKGAKLKIHCMIFDTTDDSVVAWDDGTFEVGATGSGAELEEGVHTWQEILDAINDFLVAGTWDTGPTCEYMLRVRDDGVCEWRVEYSGANHRFLASMARVNLGGYRMGQALGLTFPLQIYAEGNNPSGTTEGSDKVLQSIYPGYDKDNAPLFTTDDPRGTWINQASSLPQWIQTGEQGVGPVPSGENWGLLLIGDSRVCLAKYTSDTQFDKVQSPPVLQRPFGLEVSDSDKVDELDVVRYGETPPTVRQVLFLEDDGATLFLRFLASTGASTYNHATYDVLGYGLGLEIPYDRISDNLVQQMKNGLDDITLSVIVVKPTRFVDIILPELVLRNLHLVMSSGVLSLVSPTMHGGASVDHALTESNKGSPSDRMEDNRSSYNLTSEYLVNHIKIEYAYDALKEQYKDSVDISNEQSKTDHGVAKPLTIRARNHPAQKVVGGLGVRQALAQLSGDSLTIFSQPLLKVRRSYNRTLYDMKPGANVTLTDLHVRDPQTGSRGITTLPGWVVRTAFNFKMMRGIADLILVPDNRRSVYSPCAQVDDTENSGNFSAGYDSVTKTLRCYANAHSLSSEAADASWFPATSEITVMAISPADPTSPTSWTDTVASQSSNDIVLTTGLAGWDNTLKYRVYARKYTNAVAAQQSYSFAGDDVDRQIEDQKQVYAWSKQGLEKGAFAAPDATRRHEYPIDIAAGDGAWDGDGSPVHPGMHRAAIDTANILQHYRTAPQLPVHLEQNTSTTSSSYDLLYMEPFYCTDATLSYAGSKRSLLVGVRAFQTGGSSTYSTIRITLTRRPPTGTDLITATFDGWVAQAEVTVSATSGTLLATQTLDIQRWGDAAPETYLCIEGKVNDSTSITLCGIPKLYVGTY